MLRNPITAVVGAVILVLAIGAIALYGIDGDGVQQAHTPPSVLDKLTLTRQPADRRANRGDRGERRRDRWSGDRGERRRERGERRRRDNGGAAQPGGGYGDAGDGRARRGERRRRGGVVNAAWEDAGGNRVQLSDLRGRFVVLNLWATWCAPCVTELPALARAKAALARDNVVVIAVNLEDQDAAKVAEFLRAHGAAGLDVSVDKQLALMRTFHAYALPLTILFDKNGREFARANGPQPWDHPDAVAYLREVANVDAAQRSDRRERGNREDRGVMRWLTRMFRWAH
jgi:thiol-disulfide isomerase/thioredoxin